MTQTSQLLQPFSFPSGSNLPLDIPNLSEAISHKQKKLDLGPVWSEEELKIFLKYFQQTGLKDIEVMQSELTEAGYKRSVNNLLAVYLKNRNFLNYNPSCAAKDLQAIMADHYDNIEDSPPALLNIPPLKKFKSEVNQDIPSFNNNKGKDPFDNFKMKEDEGLTLKKKSTSVKRGGGPLEESFYNQSYRPKKIHSQTNSLFARERPKKQRKSTITRGKFPVNYNFKDQDIFKNIEMSCRNCGGKSKKNFSHMMAFNQNNKDLSTPFFKFVDCEKVYSKIDAPYFEFNEFQRLVKDVKEDGKFNQTEWSVLRSCMGKPRRFSNKFISEERDKLQKYRNLVRNYLYDKAPLPENRIHPEIAQKVRALQPLQVSQIVLAVHPVCKHIHPGSILTIADNNVILKFFPNELGAISVPDSKVITISQDEAAQIVKHFDKVSSALTSIPMSRALSENGVGLNLLEKKVVDEMDMNTYSLMIKMLERKTALVSELRNLNNMAEADPESLDEKLRQEYGWTGVQIKLLDNALKHTMAKSRLRGSNTYDADTVSDNLEHLLRNPLRSMIASGKAKGENGEEPEVIKEIKGLLNKSIEDKINSQIKNLTDKFSEVSLTISQDFKPSKMMDENEEKNDKDYDDKHRNHEISTCGRSEDNKDIHESGEKSGEFYDEKENVKMRVIDDVDDQGKEGLKTLVNNMMGVLFSLKYQGDLSMTENKYLTGLHTEVYEENAKDFHEINTVLLNICSK